MAFDHSPPRKDLDIAVVGSGISGLSAAWLLSKAHRVTLYERDDRFGGHSNTVSVDTASGAVPVDTGFIVFNERNYPNLTALFAHLGVETADSDMSFAASLDDGALEYAGTDINGLFGQRSNIVNLRFWRMVTDLLRFYRSAPAVLRDTVGESLSLGDYLAQRGYGDAFIENHLLPMGAAIWSTSMQEMKAYPVTAFVRFFVSHGLLNLTDRPQWRTVVDGSQSYVRKLTNMIGKTERRCGVRHIRRLDGRVRVETEHGHIYEHDHVVIAAHADEALKMLGDPDDRERRLLGAWRYTDNRAILHSDPSLMPRRRRVWASWNFLGRQRAANKSLCVTYWMNKLQPLPTTQDLFVTLNPVTPPAASSVIQTFDYTHPYFDTAAMKTQPALWALQGQRNTWFCGSYFGYGFHEDGLQSGLAVAEQLGGIRRPWTVEAENGRIHLSRHETEKAI